MIDVTQIELDTQSKFYLETFADQLHKFKTADQALHTDMRAANLESCAARKKAKQ